MNKQQVLIEKINELGKLHSPFFLFVDFNGKSPLLFTPEELAQENIQIAFPHFKTDNIDFEVKQIQLKKFPLSFDSYKKKFDKVHQHLQYGNSFLTNLTCQTDIEMEATLDELFLASNAMYKIKFKDDWVCFSPETFIKIEGNIIHSFPMKGTIDASLPNAEHLLLNDAKEIAEHYTIVDLIRNDISMVATNVQVNRFRYLDKLVTLDKSLLQVSSHITGTLPSNYHKQLGTLLFTLLPAGSISGAPKTKTIEIIQEAEEYERGFYTGTAFYFDGDSIDSCVLIRFIERKEQGSHQAYIYKSGGGITINSDAKKEYQELIDKIYVPSF